MLVQQFDQISLDDKLTNIYHTYDMRMHICWGSTILCFNIRKALVI